MRDWPGNDLKRLTSDDRVLHDHLCELLSDRMSEADVCTASVGIWGAISIMRDKLNLTLFELDAAKTRIKDLEEAAERSYQISQDFNNMVKERKQFQDRIKWLEMAVENYRKLDSTVEPK